jgi:hypothetical protein
LQFLYEAVQVRWLVGDSMTLIQRLGSAATFNIQADEEVGIG